MWKLPGYVIEELIGFGSSGEVWRARVAASGDPVAIKRVALTGSAAVQAARAEAALLSVLDHPHLIRLHDLVPTADAIALILDLAAGGSLADVLDQRGRLSPGEVIAAVSPIAAALEYAHNEGVVHGDVTPANVLFSEVGKPMLADLGVARIVGDDGPVLATPAYLDPSVAAGCAPGSASDVFMVAAVAFHALTGAPVWSGGTPEEVLRVAAAGDLTHVPARLAAVPGPVAAVVERGLALEPYRRGTAAEFALDLRHSGDPTEVELAAGRPRAVPARHRAASVPMGSTSVPVGAGASAVAAARGDYRPAHDWPDDEPGRPAFGRPGFASIEPGRQLTHSVRSAVRPTLPPARGRWRSRFTRGRALGAAALLLVVALGGGGLLWARHSGPWQRTAAVPPGRSQVAAARSAPPARSTAPPARSTAPPARSTAPPARSTAPPARSTAPTRPAAAPALLSDADAAGLLYRLDALRARAYAERAPALLARVYLPGSLLTEDTAQLLRTVPAGCGLAGVQTSYSAVRARAGSGGRIVVTTTATLASSRLTCAGHQTAVAPGAGPLPLRIELQPRDGDYLLAAQVRI